MQCVVGGDGVGVVGGGGDGVPSSHLAFRSAICHPPFALRGAGGGGRDFFLMDLKWAANFSQEFWNTLPYHEFCMASSLVL